jgi:hypothetical protein
MSKKSKKRRPKGRKPPAHAKFATGIQVRVKKGRTVPEFPDIPLGGWSGTIMERDASLSPPDYLVEWDRYTLEQMHPVYHKRCQRDGLELESMWLDEDDIEPDTGAPAAIEQPARIFTRPLKPGDQNDRIRAIFGLTSDDPLPEVSQASLRRYHEYLTHHLALPFQTSYQEANGRLQYQRSQITVQALLDQVDYEDGLLCQALEQDHQFEFPLAWIEGISARPNRQLVQDYSYWFWNWQGEGNASSPSEEASQTHDLENSAEDQPGSLRGVALVFAKLGLVGGFCGAILGAALASLDGASVAAKVGAILFAVVLGLLGSKFGYLFAGPINCHDVGLSAAQPACDSLPNHCSSS